MGPITLPLFRTGTLTTLAFALAIPLTALAQKSPKNVARTRLFSDPATQVNAPAVMSPDEKWVVFGVMESPSKSTLAVTRIGTKRARPLTNKGWWDGNPEWSPSGERIYFISNRPAAAGDQNYYGMVVHFNPRTGRTAGESRQITTDPVAGGIRASPDGKWLAYMDARDRRLLKVISAEGGQSRVVARVPARSVSVTWSRDGSDLYFVTNVVPQRQRALNRVSVTGGEIVTVSELPPVGQYIVGPGAETFVYQSNDGSPRERFLRIYDRRGKLLQTIASNLNTRATQITRDGRSIITVENDIVAPTRIMAIEGGAFRDVTPPVAYDWVMRWSDDGKMVYTWTKEKGADVLAAVPVNGGTARSFPETAEWGNQGGNSRYLFQASRRDGTKPRSIVAVDIRTGARHIITESAPGPNMSLPYEPGGTWATRDELYYIEKQGDVLAVKGWRGPDSVRTIRSLPATVLGRSSIAIHGNRMVWQEERGDSVDLMIADGGDAQPRRLLTMPVMQGTNELAFSNDGRLLSMHFSRGPGSPDLMAFVDPTGNTPPRIIDPGLSYWYWPRWMPDNSAVLVVGGGAGAEAEIVRIPVVGGAKPVTITRSDPASKWGFELSPDGRYIAYPGEIWKGSSVWKINVERAR